MTEIFMHKQEWTPNTQASCCFSCNSKFTIVHRRHHCRMCGQIFDSKCCRNYVSPPLFTYLDEKKIRLCDPCHKKAMTYMQQGRLSLKKKNLSSIPSVIQRKQELENGLQILLTTKVYKLSDEVLAHYLTQNQLHKEWYAMLKSIVKETLELITPDTLQEDQININNFIKIKKIPFKDQSLTHLIEGVTIRKNVLHKKMMKDHSNPRILMIKGSLDENICDDISIMDLHSLDKGKDTFRGILKKIVKLNPQIIITEGSISRIAQEFLLESNKTLVMKVRRHQFKHIARSTKSKPIDDLEDFNHLDQSVLGTCKKFYVTNYQNKPFYQEIKKFKSGNMWDSFDPSLMSFEGSVARNSVTIFISGPDHEQLIKVKQSLREIFHILQILFSERSVISQEIFLFHTKTKLWNLLSQGSNQINFNSSPDIRNLLTIETYYRELITEVSRQACLLNESTVATIGYNLRYCTERTPISKLMESSNLIFTKLVLVPIDISSFPDLTNMSESSINKLKVNLKNSPRWHQDELCQIEKRPQLVKLRCFEKGDMTLGTYLLNQASKVSEKCLSCHRSFYNHIIFFFTKQYYIKVTLELQDSQKLQQINKDSKRAKIRPSNGRGENIRNKEGFLEYLAHVAPMGGGGGGNKKDIININSLSPTNAFDFIAISNSPPPNASNQKKKLHADMLKDVKMYVECSKCKTKLSERIGLWQSYLECSFLGYLDNMIASSDQCGKYFEYDDIGGSGEPESQFLRLIEGLPKDLNVNDCCPFSPKNRVFIVDDLLIKFRVGYSKPYSFSKIDFRNPQALELEKKLNQEIITTKGAKFNELKAEYLKLILNGMKDLFQNIMAPGTLEINLENMMLIEDLIQGNGESLLSAKEPGCTMLLDLLPIYKNLLKLMVEVENESNAPPANHLELEFSRQTFLEKISELSDLLYKIHHNQEKLKAESKEQTKKKKKNKMKETQSSDEYMNNSKSMQEEAAEFTLEESSPSKLCAEEDEVSMTDKRNLSQEISEIANQTTSYDYDIEQEINYLQKLFAGIPFYPEDLELNQFAKYKTMPVYDEQPLSAIAFALNSAQYLKEVFMKEEFNSFDDLLSKSNGENLQQSQAFRIFLENKLCMDENLMNKSFSFKFAGNSLEVKCFDRLTIALSGKSGKQAVKRKKTVSRDLIDDIARFIDIGANKSLNHILYSEKITFPSFQVSIYYPAQFEALRMLEGLQLGDYLLSLACSQNWDDNSGGKTGASFIKTYDQKFVFKQLDKKEFSMLLGFTPKYLKYMWESNNKKQPSLLSKIYGIYEIKNEKNTKYLIAMENMFFGLGKGVKVYDLKGSELNRYAGKKNEEDAGTLLDTNYRVDRNGEPLPIKSECHEFIDQGIKEDTEFLAGLKVVDYSLLLILDEKNKVTRMGIIDYLRIYDLEKQLEHVGKKFITGGTTPTITGPDDYKNRFQKAMSKYFMEVNTA